MTRDEIITLVTRQIMELSTKFDADNFSDAVGDAERELGFSCPVTTDFQIRWMVHRTKRALISFLLTGAAKKVRYEQINLEQAFANYRILMRDMDAEFSQALKENPFEFAGVSACQMFGTKIDAGFQYEPVTGLETTYTRNNKMIINPTDADN